MLVKGNSAAITLACAYCGGPAQFYLAWLKHYPNNRRFCSRSCFLVGRRVSPEDRLKKHLARIGEGDGCWEWPGQRNPNGYGVIRGRGGRTHFLKTHRVSWTAHYGPIPDGLWVLHRCDNPPCIRPDHLFLGTAQDNSDDMVSKGRSATGKRPTQMNTCRGEQHGQSKLSENDVREIRCLYQSGDLSQRKIGERFGVTQNAVSLIVQRKTWAHVA